MWDQIKLLLDALLRLGIEPEKKDLADLEAYFNRKIQSTLHLRALVDHEEAGSSG